LWLDILKESSNKRKLEWILIKRGPKLELGGTSDNIEKGEEDSPKMQMKKDLDDEELWNQVI
jgi:hypothetical protein